MLFDRFLATLRTLLAPKAGDPSVGTGLAMEQWEQCHLPYLFESKQIIPEIWMQEPILVLDANKQTCKNVCAVLKQQDYQTTALYSLTNLEQNIRLDDRQIVIVDLDSLPADNRFFRGLRRKNPGICIIALSSRSFHPELEEAMSRDIYACLGKPVDEEELVFWVKSLCDLH